MFCDGSGFSDVIKNQKERKHFSEAIKRQKCVSKVHYPGIRSQSNKQLTPLLNSIKLNCTQQSSQTNRRLFITDIKLDPLWSLLSK